jgi:oligopeptidase B
MQKKLLSKKIFSLITVLILCDSLYSQDNNYVDFPTPFKKEKQDTLFDLIFSDPYYWMKDKDSIYVLNHLIAENEYVNRKMSDYKLLRLKIYEELKSRINPSYTNLATPIDSFNYYTKYEKGDDFSKYYRVKNNIENAEETLVFDFNKLKEKHFFFIPALLEVSPNHEWLAYGIDDNGDREMKIFFKNIEKDSAVETNIPSAMSMEWSSDNKYVYFTKAEKLTKRAYQLFRYKVGEPIESAELIYQENHPEFQIGVNRSKSNKYIFMFSSSDDVSEVSILDAYDSISQPKKIISRELGISASLSHEKDNLFYMVSNKEGLNYGVYSSENIENFKMLIRPKNDTLINQAIITGDYLITSILTDAQNLLQIFDKQGNHVRTLKESIDLVSIEGSNPYNIQENKIRITKNTFLKSTRTFDYWIDKDSLNLIFEGSLKFDYQPENYKSERIYVDARDGKKVPVSLIYKKNVDLNKANPLYLTAYGSYGSTTTPYFSRNIFSYLDRGFLYAIAHTRGSSALGREWYLDGKMLNKLNTFYDFIDVANHFQNEGLTSPEITVIQGGSAGGLLVGAALNISPETFGCAIANVPFVDVINTMSDDKLPLTTFEYKEWGNPKNKNELIYMAKYSPYDNVKNQSYPPILATAGYHDSQVGYWEPAKWVARLREMKTDTNEILFSTNMNSGHGGSSGRYGELQDQALEMAFIFKTLGFEENYVTIQGRVLDPFGEGFPLCNVVIEGTSQGTISNEDGYFSIALRSDKNLKLLFSALGFEKKTFNLDPNTFKGEIEVKMKSKDIQLQEVKISSNAKDPAYGIIKKAIEYKKIREEQLKAFEAEIYIKNTSRLDEIPEKIPAIFKNADMPDSNDLGLLGVTESIAKYYFEKPNKVKEEMIASKKSGTQQGFSWNRASDILFDFYQNNIELAYYSQRPFLSPLANTALFNYKYQLEGVFYDGEKAINRIKITPRRKGDPLFHGYIEIREDTWDIYSLDLLITKDAQIEFVDTVWLKQDFIEIEGVMMPLQVQMNSKISLFGFKANDLTVGAFNNYKINPLFDKKFFSNQLFSIQDGANKKNMEFWEKSRGALLTDEEHQHYIKSDSISEVKNSKAYRDSVNAKYNKVTVSKILFSGYSHFSEKNNIAQRWQTNGLFTAFQFDPVQGFSPALSLSRNIFNKESYNSRNTAARINYSTKEDRLYFSLSHIESINPKKFSSFEITVANNLQQYNEQNPIPPIYETFSTLFFKSNYINYLRSKNINTSYRQEIRNGLFAELSASVAQKIFVDNNSNFSFFNKENEYKSQLPINEFEGNTIFNQYERFKTGVSFVYQHNQKYEMTPQRKINLPSKYPSIYLSYDLTQGMRNNMNLQLVQAGVGKDFNFKMLGTLKLDFNAGYFVNQNNVLFPEFHHFRANEIYLLYNENNFPKGGLNRSRNLQFSALEYYRLSTVNNFVQIHAYHNFQGWLLGKVPYVRKLKWNAIVGANSLYTKDISHTELYVGISNIFKFLRIDFVTVYEPNRPIAPAIRFGIGGFATQ